MEPRLNARAFLPSPGSVSLPVGTDRDHDALLVYHGAWRVGLLGFARQFCLGFLLPAQQPAPLSIITSSWSWRSVLIASLFFSKKTTTLFIPGFVKIE